MAFQPRADLQNQAIGWLQREYSSLDGGTGQCENFCLFSCTANGHPAAAIDAVTIQPPGDGTGEDEYLISPLFVSVGPGIALADHDGRKA